MRRLLPLLLLLIFACQTVTGPLSGETPQAESRPPAETGRVPARVTPSPPPVTVPPPTATLSLPEIQPPTPTPNSGFALRYHPDGALITGDQISLEILAPPEGDYRDKSVRASVGEPAGSVLEPAEFGRFGIQGRRQATLWWAWDTAGLPPGEYTFTFEILPEGETWTDTVTLAPASAYPYPEPEASWATIEIDCCIVHYITGTAADRDLETLLDLTQAQADAAIARMGMTFAEPIPITFMGRVLGHGGFAGGEIYISYLDRNYAGNAPAQVIHHEMIHILDGRLGGEYRPSLFVEGLAVHLSGGHFKKEPVFARTGAALELGWYLPLAPLADDFYHAQHELSYMQAAALIQYMIDRWGEEAFNAFYRDMQPPANGAPSDAIDEALQAHFDVRLAELETDFKEALRKAALNPDLLADVELTVRFFDTVRRYQQVLDTSAYFLTAWLPHGPTMREKGIVADLLRHPTGLENLALETLLVAADADLRAGRYERVELALRAANAVLTALEEDRPDPFRAHPLAADHLAIAEHLTAQGYTPQRVEIDGDRASVWATVGPRSVQLELYRDGEIWRTQ